MESMIKETYPLRIITNWCKYKGIEFRYCSYSKRVNFFYEHGIRIQFNNYELSVQTHPEVACWAFAETLKSNDMTSDVRHDSPKTLFEYIEELIDKNKNDKELIDSVTENN